MEVDFPFGSFTHSFTPPHSATAPQPGSSKRQRGDTCEEANLQPPEKKQARGNKPEPSTTPRGKKGFSPEDCPKDRKFNCECLHNCKFLDENDFKNTLPTSMQNREWVDSIKKLNAASISAKSWKKYNAAFNKLTKFGLATNTEITWPLSGNILNGFVTWSTWAEKLSNSTVKSYIMALSRIQKAKGFPHIQFSKSYAKNLLTGAKNLSNSSSKHKKQSSAISFHRLKMLKQKIHENTWEKTNKKTIWACLATAFFGSFRMGELITEKSKTFDKTSNLTWNDIHIKKEYCKIHIKQPKSNKEGGEFVYLFPFPLKKLCPIHALKKMKQAQIKEKIWDKTLPVFRFKSGKNLTKTNVNCFLSKCFSHSKKKFTNKSFRCGIPSSLGNFPDIANDQHIKGWGRWKSNTFLRYEHFGIRQKKYISDIITRCLMA